MSKTETKALFQLFSEFINGLNNEQYQALINGNATIAYQVDNNNSSYDHLKEAILKSRNQQEIEIVFKGMLKKEILSFCEYYQIDVKKRETKKVLFGKIATHFHIVNQADASQPEEVDELDQVKEVFQQIMRLNEAKQFLSDHKLLQTKKEMIRFAKLLDVYVDPKKSKEVIVTRIVESVIGSQVRAKVIKED